MVEGSPHPLAALPETARSTALARWRVLQPVIEDGVPLTRAAAAAGVPLRTASRWLTDFREHGLAGLARTPRSDRGQPRTLATVVSLVEGLALHRPAPSIAQVHRDAVRLTSERGWPSPSYSAVRAIIGALDRGLMVLAHEGTAAYRDRFELVRRWEASAPNAIWQADHTRLDVMILDASGRPARPWLTVILDDYSRVIAGYAVYLEDPSALQTALALRQAIWRKAEPSWAVCGLPDVLYTDHGSDVTSHHLEQVAADLHVRLTFSTPGVPQGRGKIERFFGTITTELLPTLPGHLAPDRRGAPENPPRLSLSQLDAALGQFIRATYNAREHPETRQSPADRWVAGGWLPRMPDSLEQLDLLLLTVAKPRIVHRDGIRFEAQRYFDLSLSDYVGEAVTIRYDPRDLGEIRVFHRDRFLCRAVNPDLAAQTISLREVRAARNRRRRELRDQINQRRSLVDELRPAAAHPADGAPPSPPRASAPARRLKLYRED